MTNLVHECTTKDCKKRAITWIKNQLTKYSKYRARCEDCADYIKKKWEENKHD